MRQALLPPGGPVIALGPTANWSGKVWPADRFVALFQALQRDLPNARAAVFAGPGEAERAMAAPVLAALPGAVDLVGGLTLAEAAACLARCRLFIGNDSGLMHLAAAAGSPDARPVRANASQRVRARRALCAPSPSSLQGPEGRTPIETLPVEMVLSRARGML